MAVVLNALANFPSVDPNALVIQAVLSGSYTTGGETIDFTAILDPNLIAPVPVSQPPLQVQVNVEAGAGAYAEYTPSTSIKTGKLLLYDAGGSQTAGTTYSAPWSTTAVIILTVYLSPLDY